jgi:hypothetical protein
VTSRPAEAGISFVTYAAGAEKFLPLITVERFPYLDGMSQEVIAGRHDGLYHLDLGLELLLDGLERMIHMRDRPANFRVARWP